MGKVLKLNTELPFSSKHIKVIPERKEQTILVEWTKLKPIPRDFMISIPNEGQRSIAHAVTLKRMGLRPGVCDLFLAYPCHGKHGLWLEMKKRKGGVVSPEQKEWIDRMNSVGYAAYVAKGWEHAVQLIEDYLSGNMNDGQ